MNSNVHTTPVQEKARVNAPPAYCPKTHIAIDMAALAQLSMQDLRSLRTALRTLGDMASGSLNQPRFRGDAGNFLEELFEFLGDYEQAVVNVAKLARPDTAHEVEWRAWVILGHEADCADNLSDFAVLAAEAAREEMNAMVSERGVA